MSLYSQINVPVIGLIVASTLVVITADAGATDFTAAAVMEKMEASARVPYISGVIEGLAYARYERDNQHLEGDNKTVVGMNCIYDWFYKTPKTLDTIYVAFGRYPTYPPGAIIGNLVKQACGA